MPDCVQLLDVLVNEHPRRLPGAVNAQIHNPRLTPACRRALVGIVLDRILVREDVDESHHLHPRGFRFR